MFDHGILGISFTHDRTVGIKLNCQEYVSSQVNAFLFFLLCNTYLGHCRMGGAGQVRHNIYFVECKTNPVEIN